MQFSKHAYEERAKQIIVFMKPDFKTLQKLCPDIPADIISQHFDRINDQYFETFPIDSIAAHVNALYSLSTENPVQVIAEDGGGGSVSCTVIAFDYPFAFSLITGILSAAGMSIQAGRAFTYAGSTGRATRQMHRRRLLRRRFEGATLQRKKIIDCFSGYMESAFAPANWKKFIEQKLQLTFRMLEKSDAASVLQARRSVNELVVDRLQAAGIDRKKGLYPIKIDIDSGQASFTRMKVYSEDTPFFLYTLSTALSLHDIVLENVRIRTVQDEVADEFDLVDRTGRKIDDQQALSRIRLSILLTKQFTYFLGRAPDPYSALARFEKLVEDLVQAPQGSHLVEMLSSPGMMEDLAHLFGASDFLWEDFIRLQYEELLPLIPLQAEKKEFIEPFETIYWRLEESIRDARGLAEKIEMINRFKDREIFQIDLDHIIHHLKDFKRLSEKLTILAEIIINVVTDLIYASLVDRYGSPRTVAGLEARFAVLGLGKLGGVALGYASDLELLFVYSDNGQTDGEKSISNAEFFNLLVKEVTASIRAKRKGVFTVDLRLRPYGTDGPLATSLDIFCRYYGKGGAAHSFERLALVRLRTIGADRELGSRIERLRDEMIYASQSIDLAQLHALREKQLSEKTQPGKINAKFSPGALVDLEYAVQLLQIQHGQDLIALRTPRIHKALTELKTAGVLNAGECLELTAAYDFLRHLINGLRMLRGSALDLFLPNKASAEFVHLARRMGYVKAKGIEPAKQLELDFETRTAVVRSFIERHFGRDSIPGSAVGNVADLVLSDRVPPPLADRILEGYGFANAKRALHNIRKLAGGEKRRELFAEIALLACDVLQTRPDPDMALNNWERFVGALRDPHAHYKVLFSQPMRLEILMNIFSGSQYLADTLIINPEFFEWVTTPQNIQAAPLRADLEQQLRTISGDCDDHAGWLNALRRFKKRWILHIGTRDICLHVPVADVVREISTLAEAIIQVAQERAWTCWAAKNGSPAMEQTLHRAFCIMALGKLGGQELNYSSDIDLLAVYDDSVWIEWKGLSRDQAEGMYSQIMACVREDLSLHTEEGYAYRVDLRLRPYGRSGRIVHSVSALQEYYGQHASLWEIQALLKLRPVAGSLQIGEAFLGGVRQMLGRIFTHQEVAASIEGLRAGTLKRLAKKRVPVGVDIKNGAGGIRDIEFLVQGLQLMNGHTDVGLLCGNTLLGLQRLREAGKLPSDVVDFLSEDYMFFRRIEHFLQIYEDRQIHELPRNRADLEALAKRISGQETDAEMFWNRLALSRSRVKKAYEKFLVKGISTPDRPGPSRDP